MKKPLMQVLIRGHPHEAGVSEQGLQVLLIPPGCVGKMPALCTGHQMFQEVCLELVWHQVDPEKISFVVHEYRLNPFMPLLAVTITSTSEQREFLVKHPTRSQQPNVEGRSCFLAMPRKRKRKARSSTKAKGAEKQPQAKAKVDWISGQINAFQPAPSPAAASDSPASDVECEVAGSDSTSSEVGDVPQAPEQESERCEVEEPTAVACTLEAPEEAEEVVRPPAVVQEEQAVSHLSAERDKRVAQPKEQAPQTQRGSTQCNSKLGLVDCGFQVAARLAKCRHCLTSVERQSVRFAYAYSLSKFHAWLHSRCTFAHLVQEGADLEQAKAFLAEVLERTPLAVEVRNAAKDLQESLQNQTAGVSSSSASTVQTG